MDKVIVIKHYSDEDLDQIVSNFPCITTGDSILIPFDCLDEFNEFEILYTVVDV